MDRTTKGLFAVVSCAVIWSTGGLLIKLIPWNPMLIAGGRSLIAALFMLATSAFPSRGEDRMRITFSPGQVAAASAYAATMLLFVLANKLTAAANAILLQYSAPIYAALLGWMLLGEKPRLDQWLALPVVLGGLVLFLGDGLASGSLAGDAVALLSGVTFGANSVLMRREKDSSPAGAFFVAHLITAAVGLPLGLAKGTPELAPGPVAALLALGIGQIGIASFLFSYGIRRVSAVQAMLASSAEPILNPVWVFMVTGELPGTRALLGGVLIVAAVTGSSVLGARSRAQRRVGV